MERDEATATLVLVATEHDVHRRVPREIAVDAFESRIFVQMEHVEEIAQVEADGLDHRVHLHAGFTAELDLALRHLVEALVLLRLHVLEREDLRFTRTGDLGVQGRDVAERHVGDGEAVHVFPPPRPSDPEARADHDLDVGVARDGDPRERRDVLEPHARLRHFDA